VQPQSPYTRAEILTALPQVEQEVASFFSSLSEEEFVLRLAEVWTPAEQLKHLNTAVSAVARGFAFSPWVLRLRFGRAGSSSRSYEQVRETYRSLLAQGAGATGEYVPPRENPFTGEVAEYRIEILGRWGRVNARLRNALERWSEADLDRVRLPHPILGKLTAREMLFFTLYHNEHHIGAAKRRLPRFSSPPPAA